MASSRGNGWEWTEAHRAIVMEIVGYALGYRHLADEIRRKTGFAGSDNAAYRYAERVIGHGLAERLAKNRRAIDPPTPPLPTPVADPDPVLATKFLGDSFDADVERLVGLAAGTREKLDPDGAAKLLGISRDRLELLADEASARGTTVEFRDPGPGTPDLVDVREERDRGRDAQKQIDSLVQQLLEARKRQSLLDDMSKHRAPPRILASQKTPGTREMAAVALLSDLHVEENVKPESVAYRNEYDLDIADMRLRRFFEGVEWLIKHHRSPEVSIRSLVLWFGGDFMTGYIHEELMESNSLSPTETIRWLKPRLRDGLHTLQQRLDVSIVVPCSYGNHGRTTLKSRVSTGYANSFEWLMYADLADEFRNNDGIRFEVTPSAHQYVNVFGWDLHFTHGDEVKYQGGVGGLGIPLLKAVPQWDRIKACDYHNLGHHHTLRDYGRAVVNGSLIGFGPYSQKIRAEFEPPAQAFYCIDDRRGKCFETPIWVDDEPPLRT